MLSKKFTAVAGAAAEATDDYFENVSLLLHGDGTNGAQNNTFLDSSTANSGSGWTITRNGNTTQGSFSPYGSNWSNYFDGSSYLTVANNPVDNITTGTIEVWINPTTVANYPIFIKQKNGTGTYCALSVGHYVNSSGTYTIGTSGKIYFHSANGVVQAVSTSTISANTWTYIAVVFSSSDCKIYINGALDSTTSGDYSIPTQASPTFTGIGVNPAADNFASGYISNIRVSNTARTISVPTAPLSSDANTVVLSCQSNRFLDNSGSANAVSIGTGSPSVQRFSPFNPTAAYSTATIGGSGYFDGSGDYLQVANNSALQIGGGSFTVEAWIYPTSSGSYRTIISKRSGGTAEWELTLDTSSNTLIFYTSSVYQTSNQVNLNQWNHVAASSNGTTLKLFINGVEGFSGSVTVTNSTNAVRIGAVDPSSSDYQYFPGYISNLRVVKGTAIYTSAFTPPTAPLTAITNTSLLLNMTNAGIYDNAMMNGLETVGNAQISTSVKKYGTGSIAFDGTGDYLILPSSPNMAMGTGDFTWECWIYATSANDQPIYECRPTLSSEAGFTVTALSSTVIRVYTSAVLVSATVSNYLNTWTHVAFTRSGSTNRLFVNGTLQSTATASDNFSNQVAIIGGGRYNSNSVDKFFTGYIDDVRITKGVARYTSNFTAPTAAFPDK